jgi:hypothetical protein
VTDWSHIALNSSVCLEVQRESLLIVSDVHHDRLTCEMAVVEETAVQSTRMCQML